MQEPNHSPAPTPIRRNRHCTNDRSGTSPMPKVRQTPSTNHHRSSTICHHSMASIRLQHQSASMRTHQHHKESTPRMNPAMSRILRTKHLVLRLAQNWTGRTAELQRQAILFSWQLSEVNATFLLTGTPSFMPEHRCSIVKDFEHSSRTDVYWCSQSPVNRPQFTTL
jgi:hypothetical protein